MATYQREIFIDGEKFSLLDWSVYGSARLGLAQVDDNILWTSGSYDPPTWTAPSLTSKGSSRSYELTNHLGNVLAVVSDLKSYVDTIGSGQPNYWDYSMANILSAQDYYPFGMIMPRRNFATDEYRFSFNGKEKDDEVKGVGNSLDFGARIYDSRLGRWLSIDYLSKKYPMHSPYNFCADNPILFLDRDGNDWFVNNQNGNVIYIKDATEVKSETLLKYGSTDNPNNYERLGPNDMFGDKVSQNITNSNFVFIDSPELFMNNRGYEKAEKALVKEQEYSMGGRIGEEDINIPVTTFEEKAERKITYVKPEELNKKEYLVQKESKYPLSSIKTVLYRLIKPFKQDVRKTVEFNGNSENLSNGFRLGDAIREIYELTRGKSKKK